MKKKLIIITLIAICFMIFSINISLATEEIEETIETTPAPVETISTEPEIVFVADPVPVIVTVLSPEVVTATEVTTAEVVETTLETTPEPVEEIEPVIVEETVYKLDIEVPPEETEPETIETPEVSEVSTEVDVPVTTIEDVIVEPAVEPMTTSLLMLSAAPDTASTFLTLGVAPETDESILLRSSPETSMPGARSATNSYGDVFLGGNYLEVGISKNGSFGTYTSAPASFNSHASGSLGLLMDGDGWNVGNDPTTGDFFLPGAPEERYGVAYKIGTTTYQYFVADRNGGTSSRITASTTDESDIENGILKAKVTMTTPENVVVENTYSFGVDDKYYRTEVKVTNNGTQEITDVRFFRSFDPDQDVKIYDNYYTYNKVICNPDSSKEGGSDNFALVVARGGSSLEGFFLVSFDNRARASHGVSFAPNSLYMSGLWVESTEGLPTYSTDESLEMSTSNPNGYTYEDSAIAMTFNIGTLEAGESTELEHFSSLDPDVISSLNKIINVISATVVNKTDSTITIDTTEGYEYSIDGGETWQTTGTFEGLEPGTEYTIISRIIGEESTSEIVASTKNEGEETPNISEIIVTENSIVLQSREGYEYSIDGGNTWQDSPEFTGLTEDTEYEFIARLKETDDTMPGKTTEPITVRTLEKSEIDLDELENIDVIVELNGKMEKIGVNKALIYLAIGEDEDMTSAIEAGQKVDIKFIVNDSKASEKELNLIKEQLNNNEVVAFTIDVSIELYVDNEFVKNIKELSKAITWTLTIPNEYLEQSQNFRIFRTHLLDSGEFEILEVSDEDSETKTYTLSSEKFSNYTFVYEKVAEVVNNITENEVVTSAENAPAPILIDTYSQAKAFAPSTGDNIIFYILLITVSTLNLIITKLIENRKKIVI